MSIRFRLSLCLSMALLTAPARGWMNPSSLSSLSKAGLLLQGCGRAPLSGFHVALHPYNVVRSGKRLPSISMADEGAWKKGWKSAKLEEDKYQLQTSQIEGQIPSDFAGTLYRNGPGLFELGENPIEHPLDGDGMICAWTFPGDGTCTFRNKFIRTDSYVREQAALERGYKGEPLKAGFFGSRSRDGLGKHLLESSLKNPANTNVVFWADRVLALYEAGMPVEMDKAGLYTVGETRISNTIPRKSSLGARPKFDPVQDRMVMFRYNLVGEGPVTIHEYDSEWGLKSKTQAPIKGHIVMHDAAMTRSKYIIHQPATSFDSMSFTLGIKSAISSIKFDASKPSTFHIVPRDGGEAVSVAAEEGAFIVQVVNAFDDKDGNVVADVIQMPRLLLHDEERKRKWCSPSPAARCS